MERLAAGKVKPGSHAWALNEAEGEPFFRQAMELGINFFEEARYPNNFRHSSLKKLSKTGI
jgi:hypothetical protein